MSMSFNINNRRYTGSKTKISNWIKEIVSEHCNNVHSFIDIFGGTGVVTAAMYNDFEHLIINDFLYSNSVIFNAFFGQEDYDEGKILEYAFEFAHLGDSLPSNYASRNYGGKFFSVTDAKKIGFIRERLNQIRPELNQREFDVLLASLLFSLDRSANTCGHYDAYIKKANIRSSFEFELIAPVRKNGDVAKVDIYRRDSNVLAREIAADVVYIDPPYSSRQYSRFYHVLENITQWKKPSLHGTAMKPAEENMSKYCTTSALDAFTDLIFALNARYLVVSYNNTYNSKSTSSKNKMTLEEIQEVLSRRGPTQVFTIAHKAFNAGKTEMEGHLEYLFVTEIQQ